MKHYYLLEGDRTEKQLYRAWIQHAFPGATEIVRIEERLEDSFFLFSGGGWPQLVQRIQNCRRDIETAGDFTHFFICLDCEEEDPGERRGLLLDVVEGLQFPCPVTIVVARRCIETWLLGHRRFMKRHPAGEDLRQYKAYYDVSILDPERMPEHPDFPVQAAFHFVYFRAMCEERGRSYTKARPNVAKAKAFCAALVDRWQATGHISSFGELIAAWRALGGQL